MTDDENPTADPSPDARAAPVEAVTARGLHGRFDVEQTFEPGVNVLFGKNGAGKTTLLHILANVRSGDFRRFAYLRFAAITVRLNGGEVTLRREGPHADPRLLVESTVGEPRHDLSIQQILREDEEREEDPPERQSRTAEPLVPTAYFPSFRTMIEAWASSYGTERVRLGSGPGYPLASPRYVSRQSPQTTEFARQLFGKFVPRVSFLSPNEIEAMLTREMESATIKLAARDRQLLSQAFLDVFAALSNSDSSADASPIDQQSDLILDQNRTLSEQFTDVPAEDARGGPTGIHSQVEAGVYPRLRDLVHSFQVAKPAEQVALPVLEV